MKHQIIEDSGLTYMVYYRPKDKAKMYETIYQAQRDFWSGKTSLHFIDFITTKLNEQGFKVCDLTTDIKERIFLRCDFDNNAFSYKNIRVRESAFGFSFRIKDSRFVCETIADVIKLIDKETKNG